MKLPSMLPLSGSSTSQNPAYETSFPEPDTAGVGAGSRHLHLRLFFLAYQKRLFDEEMDICRGLRVLLFSIKSGIRRVQALPVHELYPAEKEKRRKGPQTKPPCQPFCRSQGLPGDIRMVPPFRRRN